MKALRYLLLATGVLISGLSYGQHDTLSISPHALDALQGSYHLLDTATPLSIWVYNVGSTDVTNDFSFDYTVGSPGVLYHAYNPSDSSGISYSSPGVVTIHAHDSLLLTNISFHFSQPTFVIGSSTVVIWPVLHNSSPDTVVVLDSASRVIVVEPAVNGIRSLSATDVQVYLSDGLLTVRNKTQNAFGDIRIYDIMGRLTTEQQLSKYTEIPMRSCADGIYMVEVVLSDGRRGVYKVVNRE